MIGFAGTAYGQVGCDATEEDKAKVVDAMRQMYIAAAKDDLAGFHSVAASGFIRSMGANDLRVTR